MTETMMPERSGEDRDATDSVPAGRRSLLGTYPVPAPHLVGAALPPAPGSPSRWQPPLPVPQYGIDYTFLRDDRGRSPRWRPGLPITVRITGRYLPGQDVTLAAVVDQLAGLTGMSLHTGQPWPQSRALQAVPEQEIHVGFRPALPTALPFPPCAGAAGLGGAVTAPGMSHYVRGFVVIAAGVTSPQPGREIAVLRHELAHALGLGHAARLRLLMHDPISVAITDYGRGDRHGLSLLGEIPPSAPPPASHPYGRSQP